MIPALSKFLCWLYPQPCIHCDQDTEYGARHAIQRILCADCIEKIQKVSQPACPICSVPFASGAALSHSPEHCCGDCRSTPPAFSRAITPLLYEGPLATAICQFKYEKKTDFAGPIAGLLTNHFTDLSIDRLMAIPLHPSRLRQREFNQALLLAREIARMLDRPYSVDALIRTRNTPPQVGLSGKERAENIKGAFAVTREDAVRQQRILLIDDVYTTGATLREGARVLMKAGAREVIVAAAARMA